MKTRFQTLCMAGLCVAMVLLFGVMVAQAETVAYWRFEDSPGFLEDSGPNNMDLTIVNGGGGGPTQYTLPATGPGSFFPDPIPQTGESNAKATQIFDAEDGFTGSDHSALTFTSGFTVEAFFNMDGAFHRPVLNQGFTSGSTDRSWQFEIRGKNYPSVLRLALSSTGSDHESVYSTLTYSDDKDHYAAASVDLTEKEVTFYLQNLTDGGELQKETISFTFSLHDSSADFFIGAYKGSSPVDNDFYLDEVRLSNTALTEGQLLVNVPEPSALALLAAGLIGLLAYAWRKRK